MPMGRPWTFGGFPMVDHWFIPFGWGCVDHRLPVGFPWAAHGTPVRCPWGAYGLPVGCPFDEQKMNIIFRLNNVDLRLSRTRNLAASNSSFFG